MKDDTNGPVGAVVGFAGRRNELVVPGHQSWLIEGYPAGSHVVVTIRAGEQDHSRALVGKLTMRPEEWQVFAEAMKRGFDSVASWGVWSAGYARVTCEVRSE